MRLQPLLAVSRSQYVCHIDRVPWSCPLPFPIKYKSSEELSTTRRCFSINREPRKCVDGPKRFAASCRDIVEPVFANSNRLKDGIVPWHSAFALASACIRNFSPVSQYPAGDTPTLPYSFFLENNLPRVTELALDGTVRTLVPLVCPHQIPQRLLGEDMPAR